MSKSSWVYMSHAVGGFHLGHFLVKYHIISMDWSQYYVVVNIDNAKFILVSPLTFLSAENVIWFFYLA